DRGATVGFVVQWLRQSSSAEASRRRAELIGGEGASIYVGNASGNLWTDLSGLSSAPPYAVDTAADAMEYDRPGTGQRLAAARAVAGTPWVVLVEVSRRVVMAPASSLLRRLAVIAGLLLIGVVLTGWRLSGGITRPLIQLTAMAEAAAAGDFSQRLTVVRRDELGRLARTFNAMADQIGASLSRVTDSEQRYRILFDGNPHPMWVVDRETLRFLAVNAAAVQRYGYTEAEFLSMT